MRNIKAVFKKQLISYFKNPERWLMPAIFLFLPFLFVTSNPDIPRTLMPIQFVIMFVGISMIGSTAGIILEDRRTMNLRFMSMAGVKSWQYLIATCGVMLLVSLGVLFLFGLIKGHTGIIMINFLIVTMLGAICSMLLGITISLSKFAPFTMIVALILGVGPVLAVDFGVDALSQIFYFTHTYQINVALRGGAATLPQATTIDELANVYNIHDMTELFYFIRELNTPSDLALFPIGPVRVLLINIGVILLAFIGMNTFYGLDGERKTKQE